MTTPPITVEEAQALTLAVAFGREYAESSDWDRWLRGQHGPSGRSLRLAAELATAEAVAERVLADAHLAPAAGAST